MYSPEVQVEIAHLRAKSIAGTMTLEDMKKAVALLRGERRSAVASSESSKRKKAKKIVKSADQLLEELDIKQ